ncbi:MAG: MSHA biogenesis protein MshJ, partial [Burkholderiaceae bacterium]
DAADRARLNNLKQQYLATQNGLLDMQKGLIAPDKMAGVLEDILRRHGRLQLMSLKTLPVTSLNDAAVGDEKIGAAASGAIKDKAILVSDEGTIYKHGVEITVQGGYLDMLNYMNELESMPWQVFWGKAKLNAEEYQQATLVLTLYTLSLDKKWLKL